MFCESSADLKGGTLHFQMVLKITGCTSLVSPHQNPTVHVTMCPSFKIEFEWVLNLQCVMRTLPILTSWALLYSCTLIHMRQRPKDPVSYHQLWVSDISQQTTFQESCVHPPKTNELQRWILQDNFTPSLAVSISLACAFFGVVEAIGGFVVNISITVAPRLLKYQIIIIELWWRRRRRRRWLSLYYRKKSISKENESIISEEWWWYKMDIWNWIINEKMITAGWSWELRSQCVCRAIPLWQWDRWLRI